MDTLGAERTVESRLLRGVYGDIREGDLPCFVNVLGGAAKSRHLSLRPPPHPASAFTREEINYTLSRVVALAVCFA